MNLLIWFGIINVYILSIIWSYLAKFNLREKSTGHRFSNKKTSVKENCRMLGLFYFLPENIGANICKSLLPTSSPHLGSFHSDSERCEYDEGHNWKASIVIHATDRLPHHALLREDVAENKCKVRYHGAHKSWWEET